MESLKELVALAREQGTIVAGWLLLLAAVAWISGQGARSAIRNVHSLLRMNEELRKQLVEQLATANSARDDAERSNSQLRTALDSANRRMDDLEGRLLFAERRSRTLEVELTETIAENRRLRDTLAGQPHVAQEHRS